MPFLKFATFATVVVLGFVLAGCKSGDTAVSNSPSPSPSSRYARVNKPEVKTAPPIPKLQAGEEVAVIETDRGKIKLQLFSDIAPKHVEHFKQLINEGFYNGLAFHRAAKNLLIQGGDPNSKNPDRASHGMGGPGHNVKAEFNSKPHKRGTLSMARANDPDSAGSQFFICVNDANFLDLQYTVFGEVQSGLDVVDKVVGAKRDGRDNPLERVEMTVTITE